MTVAAATVRISREVPDAEAAIEDALVASAALLLTAATARRDTGVRAPEAHAALLRISKLNQTLIEASGEARRAHRELRRLADRTIASDPSDNCPQVFTTAQSVQSVA